LSLKSANLVLKIFHTKRKLFEIFSFFECFDVEFLGFGEYNYIAKLKAKEKAILVGVKLPSVDRFYTKESLEELKLLAETAGAEVLDRVIQERHRLDPAFFIGKGKADQIARCIIWRRKSTLR